MKRKTKVIIILLLFLITSLFLIVSINIEINEANLYVKKYEEAIHSCEYVDKNNIEEYKRCLSIINDFNREDYYNFYVILGNTITWHINSIGIIMILIIDSAGLIFVNKMFNNKYVVNYYIRAEKSKLLKDILKESYIYIIPISCAFLVSIVYLRLRTNLSISNSIVTNWSFTTIKNIYLFLVLYILQLCLFLASYINIGIIMSRRHCNYIVSLISTYLVFISWEIFQEFCLGRLFKIKYSSYLSIANPFCFDDRLGILSPIVFPAILFIITTIVVLIIFNNKEKVYLDTEKI